MSRLTRRLPSPAMIVALVALFVALSGTALAANGGGFILGQSNTATNQTSLTANRAGKALQVTNTSTGTGATPLGLNAAAGHAPFTTNSQTKVQNLNSDLLDGLDSSALQKRVTGTCSAGNAITAIGVAGTANCAPFSNADDWLILNHSGPLATQAEGSFDSDGSPFLMIVSASGYSSTANTELVETAYICTDTPCSANNSIGDPAQMNVFSTEANSHKTLTTSFSLNHSLGAGTYYVRVQPDSGTLTDANDFVHILILRL